MKFRLYRPKHLRIEGIGESIIRRLRSLLVSPRKRAVVVGGTTIGVAVTGALAGPVNASALENNMIDTNTETNHTQTVDYNAMVSDDELTAAVNSAVAESQAITDSRQSTFVQETAPVQETIPVQETVPVQETASVQETIPVQETAPVQETVPVQETAPVQETVPVQETTQIQETTPSVNTEIDNRVPQVETTTDTTQTETEVVNDEVSEPTVDMTTGETTENLETEEKLDSNQQPDMGIVSDNPIVLDQDTSSTVDQTTESNSDTMESTDTTTTEQTEEKEESVEVTVPETEVNENTNADYQVISQDGNLIIVGNISEDQLSQVIEDLTNQYGEDAVSGLTIFDYDTINSQVDYGETVQLGNSGYTAIKHEDGSIEVRDANGNLITSWQGQEMNIEDNQEITVDENQEMNQNQTLEDSTFSEDLTIPEDYEHRDYEVNTDEYLVIENADGSYTIAMGGVGLSGNQLQDLISKLQSEGIIPADAQVTPGILPSAPTDEMIEHGKTERLAQVGDYIISTTDGKTYTVYAKDGTVLDTILKYDDQQLDDNYETSKDPDAETGNKPGQDEPGNEIPGDKPGEDTPGIPQMGDEASLAQMVAAGLGSAGLIGAGLAGTKKRKKGVNSEDLDDDSFEPTYDDLELAAKQWSESEAGKAMQAEKQASAYDYDELEAIAEQWKNSKEREEWLQQKEKQSKGRTR